MSATRPAVRRLDVVVGVAERHAPALGEQRARPSSCPRPSGRRARRAVPVGRAAHVVPSGCRGSPPRCGGSRSTESPPNFSSTASASTSATIASATTPAAGTAQTSERWWWATAASPVATSTVRSARGHGGDRLHRRPHAQHLAGRHAALGATGASRRTPDGAVLGERSRRAPGEPRRGGELEAVADLDALDRLDAHQRAGQPRVEPAVPVHVRAEPRRQAVDDDLDDTAEGVAVLVGLVDRARPSAALASGSRQRTGSVVEARRRRRARAPTPAGPATPPSSIDVGDEPGAGRLLEEGARPRGPARPGPRSRGREARSRTGRASSKSYFCMPTRSA